MNIASTKTEIEREWEVERQRLITDARVKRLWLPLPLIKKMEKWEVCPAPDFKPGVYWVPETFGTATIHTRWGGYWDEYYDSGVKNFPLNEFQGQALYRIGSLSHEEEEFEDGSKIRWWSPVVMPKKHARTFVAVETLEDGTRWMRPLSPPRDYAGSIESHPQSFHPLGLTHYQTGMTAYVKAVSVNTWLVGVTGKARIEFVSIMPRSGPFQGPQVLLSLRLRESNCPSYWGHSWVNSIYPGGHSHTLALVDDPETVRLYLLELSRVVGETVTLTPEKALESDAIYWSVKTPSKRMVIGLSIVYALEELPYFFYPHLSSDLNIYAIP